MGITILNVSRNDPHVGAEHSHRNLWIFRLSYIWECSALNSQRMDKSSVITERVEHLRDRDFGGELRNSGANALLIQVCS
jgi:hypothetical protein